MKPPQPKGPKGINWAAERDLYATGNESLRAVAQRLGVSNSAVTRVATDADHEDNHGKKWIDWRSEFRESVGSETRDNARAAQVAQAILVSTQQRVSIASLVAVAMPKALSALDSEDLEPKDRIRLALALLTMQRRVLGLDRTSALDFGGDDDSGEPEVNVDPVTDAAARTVLEAALGRTPNPS